MERMVFIGTLFVDGRRFTHPDFLTGCTGRTEGKCVAEMRRIIKDNLDENWVRYRHVLIRVTNPLSGVPKFISP